jgi:hypothetical protein
MTNGKFGENMAHDCRIGKDFWRCGALTVIEYVKYYELPKKVLTLVSVVYTRTPTGE